MCFFLRRLGPPEYEITDFEYPPSDLPFVVPAEGLLVASGADDGCLTGLFEQVDYVLLSLRGSVAVESLHSWGAVVEVEGQYCFSSIGRKKGVNPMDRFGVVLRLWTIAGTSATYRPAYLLSRSKMHDLSPWRTMPLARST